MAPREPEKNAVQLVDEACERLEAERRLAETLTYEDVKRAWDEAPVKHSKVRATAAGWLSRIRASELEGRDVAADFEPRVAEMARGLREHAERCLG